MRSEKRVARSEKGQMMVGQTFLSALILSLVFTTALRGADDKPTDVKLEPIFNAKDLTGWTQQKPGAKAPDPATEKYWKVVDGVLVGESDAAKKSSMLYTEKQYKDVAVEADVRWTGEIDSGIMIRKPEVQVQIGVSRSLKKDMTASIYAKGGYPGKAHGVEALLKPGEWNKMRVEARGPVFKVWLNGKHVLTWESADFPDAGPIGLQIHGGVVMKVEFKDLKAAELK